MLDKVWTKVKTIVDAAFTRSTATLPTPTPATPVLTADPYIEKTITPTPATPLDVEGIAETVKDLVKPEELKEATAPDLSRLHTAGMLLELDDNVKTAGLRHSGRRSGMCHSPG